MTDGHNKLMEIPPHIVAEMVRYFGPMDGKEVDGAKKLWEILLKFRKRPIDLPQESMEYVLNLEVGILNLEFMLDKKMYGRGH